MKSMPTHQRGLTMISLILILGLIAFFTMLILKIGPIYMDHSKVLNALAALENTPDVETKSQSEVQGILSKRFNMNYVDHVTRDDIKIIKGMNYLKVVIEYERVEPIIGNLSALAEFHDEIEVGNE